MRFRPEHSWLEAACGPHDPASEEIGAHEDQVMEFAHNDLLHYIAYHTIYIKWRGKRTRASVKWKKKRTMLNWSRVVGSLRALDKCWEHRPVRCLCKLNCLGPGPRAGEPLNWHTCLWRSLVQVHYYLYYIPYNMLTNENHASMRPLVLMPGP